MADLRRLKWGGAPGWVALVSGIVGFRVGMLGYPDWQVAVETAQVVAGVVEYPMSTPFSVYHAKLWTILHHICAIFLFYGVSEWTLSLIVSGVLGSVSFMALALAVYALSRDAFLAVGAPVLIFVTRAAEFGAAYPVLLLGETYTYGIIGLSWAVLVAAALGAGCYRTGGFLLGLAPAVHPSIGTWLAAVVGIAFLTDFTERRRQLHPALPHFFAGCTITAASLMWQWIRVDNVPPLDPATAERYLSAFVKFWDVHRQPVALNSEGMQLNLAVLVMGLLWLTRFKRDVPYPALFLLRISVGAAAVSMVLAALTWIPPERIPPAVLMLMPGRMLNFNVLVFPTLLLGLTGAYQQRLWSPLLLVLLVSGLMLAKRSLLWDWIGVHGEASPVGTLAVLAIGASGLLLGATVSKSDVSPNLPAFALRLPRVVIGVAGVVLAFQLHRSEPETAGNRLDDFFLREVAQGRGMLLVGGEVQLIQLRTRRPVLVDAGGLDGFVYAVDSGPQLEEIMRNVYGLEFFHPPANGPNTGTIPSNENKAAWEGYSREKWREIGRTYQLTHVLTPGHWILDLPLAAHSRTFLLHEIPK